DFDSPAKVLVTEHAEDDLYLSFGVRYNEIYPRRSVLPYLGLGWLPSETVRVDVLLPETVEMSLWPRRDLGFLLGAEVQGAEYHVNPGAAAGRVRGDVRVQEVFVYGGAIWRTSRHASVTARIGATVAGDYRLDDSPVASLHVDGTLQPGL